MNDDPPRTLEQTALAAQEFLETLGRAMVRLELAPLLVISLFGKYAERLARHEVESSGRDQAEVMMEVFTRFAQGLGMQTTVKPMSDAEAEIARAELRGPATPLQ